LEAVVAPKPTWDAGIATTKQVEMGGSLTTPTAPQRTDVDPNRCGEPVSRLQGGTHAPQGAGRRSVQASPGSFPLKVKSLSSLLILNGFNAV